MQKLKINNTEFIHYQLIAGNETMPYLVFLHEGLGCCEMWKGFPERLCHQTGYRGLIYDRIGYGKSSPITNTRTIHYLHDYALNELPLVINDLIPNTPFILVGHSDGASISLIYGSKKTTYLQGIISEAAHVMVEDETCEGIKQADKACEENKWDGLYKYHGDKTAQMFKAWSSTWLQPWFKSWNIEYLLPCIEVPVLVLQGANDQYASIAQVTSIQKLSGGKVEAHLLENCDHSPHLADSEKVLLLMTTFIHQYAIKRNLLSDDV
jgi:pimeloyl-ACP methyl ester carboxylesterase